MNIVNDTPELRAELDAHNANAIRLHLPTAPVTWIDMKVEAPDGKVIHERREKANSWTRNFYNALACAFLPSSAAATFGEGYLGLKDTGGTARALSTSQLNYGIGSNANHWIGGSGATASGIYVGTGDSAESFESYALETPIVNGGSDGQLAYQTGSVGTAQYNSGTKKWTQTISRVFNNNGSTEITVKECGLYVYTAVASCSMVDRSLLVSPVSVPAAYKLTVTYTTEITFPA